MRILVLSSVIVLGACVGEPFPSQIVDPTCQIRSEVESKPGYPYDLKVFREQVLPILTNTCATASCHGAAGGQKGFALFAKAAPGSCEYAKNFNAFTERTNLDDPLASKVYRNPAGENPAHPLKLGTDNADVKTILGFIEQAKEARAAAGGGTAPPPVSANPFDYARFASEIQPILDNAEGRGCAIAGCHLVPNGQAGFKLHAKPAAGSQEMEDNFKWVTALADLTAPDQSRIYVRAILRHGVGASSVFSPAEGELLLDWIKDAQANAAPGNGGGGANGACPSPTNFDSAVFRDEILPILLGEIDLNDPTGNRVTTGCARSGCHGTDRTGGALVLKATAPLAENLANFACFVNLTQPSASEILACPLDQPGCRRSPHPGQDVFGDAADRNYQRILSYLYAAKTAPSPLDFAFYARKINPLFGDQTLALASGRTCADGGCHGTSIVGQAAPNGSNFPILASASDKNRLLFNFGSAVNFTNFLEPRGSSLFLYPTNEIANLANPFATGLSHPGGQAFSADSEVARTILTWAGGLRPDGNGRQPNWLVAGDFAATQVSDFTGVDEVGITPAIFDRSGASQFNNGEWDGLFADRGVVDLAAAFPRAQQNGRVAYAVAYLINTTGSDIQADLALVSPNAVKVYVGNQPVLQANDASAGVSALATLPAFATSRKSTRVLVKVFQRPDDRRFEFQLFLRDSLGNALGDLTGELVVKLSPDGGI